MGGELEIDVDRIVKSMNRSKDPMALKQMTLLLRMWRWKLSAKLTGEVEKDYAIQERSVKEAISIYEEMKGVIGESVVERLEERLQLSDPPIWYERELFDESMKSVYDVLFGLIQSMEVVSEVEMEEEEEGEILSYEDPYIGLVVARSEKLEEKQEEIEIFIKEIEISGQKSGNFAMRMWFETTDGRVLEEREVQKKVPRGVPVIPLHWTESFTLKPAFHCLHIECEGSYQATVNRLDFGTFERLRRVESVWGRIWMRVERRERRREFGGLELEKFRERTGAGEEEALWQIWRCSLVSETLLGRNGTLYLSAMAIYYYRNPLHSKKKFLKRIPWRKVEKILQNEKNAKICRVEFGDGEAAEHMDFAFLSKDYAFTTFIHAWTRAQSASPATPLTGSAASPLAKIGFRKMEISRNLLQNNQQVSQRNYDLVLASMASKPPPPPPQHPSASRIADIVRGKRISLPALEAQWIKVRQNSCACHGPTNWRASIDVSLTAVVAGVCIGLYVLSWINFTGYWQAGLFLLFMLTASNLWLDEMPVLAALLQARMGVATGVGTVGILTVFLLFVQWWGLVSYRPLGFFSLLSFFLFFLFLRKSRFSSKFRLL